MHYLNRTIKFRIYHRGRKEWIHGPSEIPSCDGVNLLGETILLGCLCDGVSIEELNDIVTLQFTGLEDKNGKEIFEGDIVKIQTSDDPENLEWEILQVIFMIGKFVMFNLGYRDFEDFVEGCNHGKIQCEVIGNIFDNPDLLK